MYSLKLYLPTVVLYLIRCYYNKRQIKPSKNAQRSLFRFFLPFLADITKVTMGSYIPRGGV